MQTEGHNLEWQPVTWRREENKLPKCRAQYYAGIKTMEAVKGPYIESTYLIMIYAKETPSQYKVQIKASHTA